MGTLLPRSTSFIDRIILEAKSIIHMDLTSVAAHALAFVLLDCMINL